MHGRTGSTEVTLHTQWVLLDCEISWSRRYVSAFKTLEYGLISRNIHAKEYFGRGGWDKEGKNISVH